MKILLVSTSDTGGAGKACVRLHLGLLEKGIDSKLLVLNQHNPEIPESYAFYEGRNTLLTAKKVANRFAIKYYTVQRMPQGYEGFSFPYSAHKLHEHPLYEWADVINLHWVALFFDYPSFFKQNKKPIAWTLHDMLPFSGGYHYEEGFPMAAYDNYIRQNEIIKQKAVKNQPLTVVTLCDWMTEKSKESVAFKDLNHVKIPNGIDTTVYKPYDKAMAKAVFNLPTDKKLMLFVAESVSNKRKGFELLQNALQKISTKDDIVLGVLGNNPVEDAGVETYHLGFIRDERLMSVAYAAADLFVIPSVEDNLPNTVVESINCGTPVVGFNIGGVPNMVTSGRNGILSTGVNSDDLANAINKALSTDFDTKAIREDAQSRFNQEFQAKNYIELFEKMIG